MMELAKIKVGRQIVHEIEDLRFALLVYAVLESDSPETTGLVVRYNVPDENGRPRDMYGVESESHLVRSTVFAYDEAEEARPVAISPERGWPGPVDVLAGSSWEPSDVHGLPAEKKGEEIH